MNHHIRCTALLLLLSAPAPAQSTTDWPAYGRDPGGSRYSPLTQVTRENVNRLTTAWTYRTGEAGPAPQRGAPPALETTPIMVDGTLFISTPLGRVIALDALTGTERWKFDPQVNRNAGYGDFNNRGVSTWIDPQATAGSPCKRRIYIATIDARLIALDAANGTPCASFGRNGAPV